jgi:hypothetical protein
LVVGPFVDTSVIVVNFGTIKGTLSGVIAPLVNTIVNNIRTLDNPDEFLNGVVEVKTRFVARASESFLTSELELFNEIFVANLGETTAFISIEIDVVDIEGSVLEVGVNHRGDGVLTFGTNDVAVSSTVEFDVDNDFVILEGNKGESKTRIAAEEELEGNVESGLGLLDG